LKRPRPSKKRESDEQVRGKNRRSSWEREFARTRGGARVISATKEAKSDGIPKTTRKKKEKEKRRFRQKSLGTSKKKSKAQQAHHEKRQGVLRLSRKRKGPLLRWGSLKKSGD